MNAREPVRRGAERELRVALRARQTAEARLRATYDELALYARDLRATLAAERARRVQLELAHLDTVRRLLDVSTVHDVETGSHLARIERYVALFGEALGWEPQRVAMTATAATLHDVGKIGVPDAILRKPGPLTAREREAMRAHTVIGARILDGPSWPLLELARQIAHSHHERWCGGGYPQGLAGEAIPLPARVVALVDQYDALRSPRSYKRGYGHAEAIAVLREGDARTRPEHFDPALLALLPRLAPRLAEVFASEPNVEPPAHREATCDG